MYACGDLETILLATQCSVLGEKQSQYICDPAIKVHDRILGYCTAFLDPWTTSRAEESASESEEKIRNSRLRTTIVGDDIDLFAEGMTGRPMPPVRLRLADEPESLPPVYEIHNLCPLAINTISPYLTILSS